MPSLHAHALAACAGRPSPRRLLRIAPLLTFVLALAGCLHDPTRPAEATRLQPGARPSADVAPVATAGSYTLAVPSTNTEGGGLTRRTTNLSVPDGAYAMIEVAGSIALGQNPPYMSYCGTTCSTPYAGQSAPPMGLGSTPPELKVTVWVQSSVYGEYALVTTAKAGDPSTRVAAGRWKGGAGLSVVRSPISGGANCYAPWTSTCPGGTTEWSAGAYTMSGTQVVRITPISAPSMTVSAPVTGSTTRTFTAVWSALPAQSVSWFFNPGDTGATPANPLFQYTTEVVPCRNNIQCVYAPQDPGRMYAVLGGDGISEAVAVSIPTNATPPVLTLSCTPSTLVRGETVTCHAAVSPAVPYRVTAVDFSTTVPGGSGSRTLGTDVAAGAGYDMAGPAVTGTTVTLHVSAFQYGDSVPLTGQATYSVTARTWAPLVPEGPPIQVPSNLDSDPSFLGDVTFGMHHAMGPDYNSLAFLMVSSGPNAGFSYLTTPPRIPRSEIEINELLDGIGLFAAEQDGTGVVPKTPGYPFCGPDGLTKLKPHVMRHEGLTMAPDSHEMRYRGLLASSGLNVTYEKAVGYNRTHAQLQELIAAPWRAFGEDPLLDNIRNFDTVDTSPDRIAWYSGGCQFNYYYLRWPSP